MIFSVVAASFGQPVILTGQESMLGWSREAVVEAKGKPVTEMRRGDRDVAIFDGGFRVEFEAGVAVKVTMPGGNIITAGDGTRYAASESGKVTRLVETRAAEPAAKDPAATPRAESPAAETIPPATIPAEPASQPDEVFTASGELSPAMQPVQVQAVENLLKNGHMELETAPAEPPRWAVVAGGVIALVLQLGFTTLLLVIGMRWIGLPYYLPDLFKTALLSVAVLEGVKSLGQLGGQWQWLQLFKADQIFGFVALCLGLYFFKVVRDGLTALKIAVAAKVATYFLMIGCGLAITFGLAALY